MAIAAGPGFDRATQNLGLQISASWELDLFGRSRAAQSAQQSRVEAAEEELKALASSLSAETARRVLELREVQAQIELAEAAIAVEKEFVAVTSARLRGGLVTQADLARAKAQLDTAEASRQRLNAVHADAVLALSVLLASGPAETLTLVRNERQPEELGLALFSETPAQILVRRPDVQAARQRLAAASADLAAAAADRFPRVNLLAAVGLGAARLASLGGSDAVLATLAPSFSWRAVDFGELESVIAERTSAQQIAVAVYRKAVVDAFSDAEAALKRLAAKQDEVTALGQALTAQQQSLALATLRHEKGIGEFFAVLDAQRQLHALEREVIANRSARAVAAVEVYRAMALAVPLRRNPSSP